MVTKFILFKASATATDQTRIILISRHVYRFAHTQEYVEDIFICSYIQNEGVFINTKFLLEMLEPTIYI